MIIDLSDPVTLKQLTRDARTYQLAFTSGCFDLFHRGHAYFLTEMQSMVSNHSNGGEIRYLVVIHGDKAVSAKKGESRPIYTAKDRAAIVDSIKGIDMVAIWEGWESIVEIVETIKPDFLIGNENVIKKTDWKHNWQDVATAVQAKLIGVSLLAEHTVSTTTLIKKIKASE